jgi:RHS repeat-associated protein
MTPISQGVFKLEYTYNNLNMLLSLVNKKSDTTVISSFSYTHDKVGNRLTMATPEGTHNYAYDSLYRLSSADHPAGADEAYTYDKVGNRKTSSQYSNWSFDANNRLLSFNGTSFTYDKNGNTLSKTKDAQTTSYTYDFENRLIAGTVPAGGLSLSYSYDPFGKRLSKTVGGVTKYYLYDNEDIIAEYDADGNLIASYVHGQGIDEPISMTRGSSTYYYTFDGLGTVSELTDDSQGVVESYKYDAFGKIESPPATGNPYTYTGREYDPESGLYFYRARYYDAGVGRFLSADPILLPRLSQDSYTSEISAEWKLPELIQVPHLLQPYAYVNNNPINNFDPNDEQIAESIACYKVAEFLILATAVALYYAINYNCNCPARTYTTIKVVPRVEWMPKPPPDPCVFICIRCVKGKWVEKLWACPACFTCLIANP